MNHTKEYPINAKKVFRECGTCSQTFAHILNTEFGNNKENEERALDQLAGGLMNTGHQCGMLWGAVLAAGAESYRKHNDVDHAIAAAIKASQHIMESFTEISGTINCREIIGYNLSSKWGLFRYMLKVSLQGIDNSHCFNLAEKWAPKAIHAVATSLSNDTMEHTHESTNCATEIARSMGATEEEGVSVAGFAGGMGFSGNACGALSTAIWLKTLSWCRDNPGKRPPYFNSPITKNLLIEFLKETNGTMRCDEITGRTFKNLEDHAKFIQNGGCKQLINRLLNA